ncbi:hypothetical protein UA32_12120 [Photobacterium angustum]|uniref:DUF7146 domain-containing protein n=1 Tax=Photobacterium angustum TaxID=661 RepID=A0ABX5GYI6_PHOAN|nr:hypothetical protein [Photobacterium angustum]KJG37702.1 hypothetical protein UA32_12120 [Photobacterium angustum]PSX03967.1 hypothetical protein C0W27_20960 [Photobacterium angustum]
MPAIDDRKDVFKLVESISDYSSVYANLGLSDIVNSQNPKKMVPCPKSGNSGNKKSTKFRFHKHYEVNGKCIHNDVNNGRYMDIITFTMWFHGESDPIDAAMTVLDAAGIEYEDLRGKNRTRKVSKPAIPVKIISPEEIIARKQRAYEEGLKCLQNMMKMWDKSLPISNPIARDIVNKYLMVRGLPDGHVDKLPINLKVNMNAFYPAFFREENKAAYYCALLIPMIDHEGRRATFHRHFFQKNTGKKIPETKKKLMMSPAWTLEAGTHMQYDDFQCFEVDGKTYAHIAIGEGLETMEAVRAAMQVNVQPMYNTTMLQGYKVPDTLLAFGIPPERILLDFYIDKDLPVEGDPLGRGAGEIAADRAIERLTKEGYQCEKFIPPLELNGKGVDWLNVWNILGKDGFPK